MLDDDSDDEIMALQSKHCKGSKHFGNINLKGIEAVETKKTKYFIDSDSDKSLEDHHVFLTGAIDSQLNHGKAFVGELKKVRNELISEKLAFKATKQKKL